MGGRRSGGPGGGTSRGKPGRPTKQKSAQSRSGQGRAKPGSSDQRKSGAGKSGAGKSGAGKSGAGQSGAGQFGQSRSSQAKSTKSKPGQGQYGGAQASRGSRPGAGITATSGSAQRSTRSTQRAPKGSGKQSVRTREGERLGRGARSGSRRSSDGVGGIGGDLVEGIQAVDALLSGDRRVIELTVDGLRADDPDVEALMVKAYERGVSVRTVTRTTFSNVAQSQTPQGVQARATPIEATALDALCEDPSAFLVALDGVTDPGNLGAVMRSACAAGATGLVLPKKRTARLSASAMKAAAGAAEKLPIALVSGIPSFLDDMKRRGIWSYGLAGDGGSTYDQVRFDTAPVVIVAGSEGDGLSTLTKRRCDALVSIPMYNGMESFNVSVATAIVCVEVARQRNAAPASGSITGDL